MDGWMDGCLCMSLCLYVCLSACLNVCMSVCLYVCMSVCLYICRSVGLYVCMSVCPHACSMRTHVRVSYTCDMVDVKQTHDPSLPLFLSLSAPTQVVGQYSNEVVSAIPGSKKQSLLVAFFCCLLLGMPYIYFKMLFSTCLRTNQTYRNTRVEQ